VRAASVAILSDTGASVGGLRDRDRAALREQTFARWDARGGPRPVERALTSRPARLALLVAVVLSMIVFAVGLNPLPALVIGVIAGVVAWEVAAATRDLLGEWDTRSG
jgi:hypothetical protein